MKRKFFSGSLCSSNPLCPQNFFLWSLIFKSTRFVELQILVLKLPGKNFSFIASLNTKMFEKINDRQVITKKISLNFFSLSLKSFCLILFCIIETIITIKKKTIKIDFIIKVIITANNSISHASEKEKKSNVNGNQNF